MIETCEEEELDRHGDEPAALTVKQERALQALLTHRTQKEAAEAAGVSETTLWRYMQIPEFSRRVTQAGRQSVEHSLTRLQRGSNDAVSVLYDLMMSEKTPPSTRILAVRTYLDLAVRATEIGQLRARVDELEEFLMKKQEEEEVGEYFYEK
jgi:hypothetical protein